MTSESTRTQTPAPVPGIGPGVRRPGLVLAFLSIAQFMDFLDTTTTGFHTALAPLSHA